MIRFKIYFVLVQYLFSVISGSILSYLYTNQAEDVEPDPAYSYSEFYPLEPLSALTVDACDSAPCVFGMCVHPDPYDKFKFECQCGEVYMGTVASGDRCEITGHWPISTSCFYSEKSKALSSSLGLPTYCCDLLVPKKDPDNPRFCQDLDDQAGFCNLNGVCENKPLNITQRNIFLCTEFSSGTFSSKDQLMSMINFWTKAIMKLDINPDGTDRRDCNYMILLDLMILLLENCSNKELFIHVSDSTNSKIK